MHQLNASRSMYDLELVKTGIPSSVEILYSLSLSRSHGLNLVPSLRTANTADKRISSRPRDLTGTSVPLHPSGVVSLSCLAKTAFISRLITFCGSIVSLRTSLHKCKMKLAPRVAMISANSFDLLVIFRKTRLCRRKNHSSQPFQRANPE